MIERRPPPISVKGVRSFLGHAGLYRRLIKDFFQRLHILCASFIRKSVCFILINPILRRLGELKEKLVSAPIIISPDWSKQFEVMCDASGASLGVVLGQRRDKTPSHYYTSKALNEAQKNYTVTEQEFLDVVFTFDKFGSYLLGTRVIVHSDHCALRHFMAKKDANRG